MIKATDLRIGNKILRMGNVVTVSTIDDCREEHYSSFLIGNYEDLASYTPKECEPISLTPEIFKKCNTRKLEKYVDFALDGFKRYMVWIKEEYVDLKYLHQLQNLYFALTGEELEIKELQHT